MKALKKAGPKQKSLLNKDFVFQVGDISGQVELVSTQHLLEIEDLVPIPICLRALRIYFAEVFGVEENETEKITMEGVVKNLDKKTSVFDSLQAELGKLANPAHIEKMGFARAVTQVVYELARNPGTDDDSLQQYVTNVKALFAELTKRQRKAERENNVERVSRKIERLKNSFNKDHEAAAKREDVSILLEDIEAVLDNSIESDAIRIMIQQIQREFKIYEDMELPVENFLELKQRLEQLRYAATLATQIPDHTPPQNSGTNQIPDTPDRMVEQERPHVETLTRTSDLELAPAPPSPVTPPAAPDKPPIDE